VIIAMIHPYILVSPLPIKIEKLKNMNFFHMEIKFTIKKMVEEMGLCFMQVHFAFGSSSMNKGKYQKAHSVCCKN